MSIDDDDEDNDVAGMIDELLSQTFSFLLIFWIFILFLNKIFTSIQNRYVSSKTLFTTTFFFLLLVRWRIYFYLLYLFRKFWFQIFWKFCSFYIHCVHVFFYYYFALKILNRNARELFIHRPKSKTIKFVFIVFWKECWASLLIDGSFTILKMKMKRKRKIKFIFRLYQQIYINKCSFNGSLFLF